MNLEQMVSVLPKYYEDIKEANEILGAEAAQISGVNSDIEDLLRQFTVDTATWGLDRWERLVGLKSDRENVVTFNDIQLNNLRFDDLEGSTWKAIGGMHVLGVEERRSAIKSKLQGYGTITESKIKEICKLYTSGNVDVQVNGPAFLVTITFIDLVGIPPNYSVLESVLREVLPAHLALEFGFRYMRWSELDAFTYTWDVLDGMNMSWDEFSEAVD